MKRNKYALYEEAVQTPEAHALTFGLIYAELKGKKASVFREDFCGTFQISCEWIRAKETNRALALDLDSEPLNYGKKNNLTKLNSDEKKRLKVSRKNVISVTAPKADIVGACNFSFYILKEREVLLKYFKAVLRSLNKNGIMILEMGGGPGFIHKIKERRSVNEKRTGKFTYIWDQKSFDPITHDAKYGIHFKFPDGSIMQDAFTYDWRLWTIPEIRDVALEAGFKDFHVYWETSYKGEGTGQYARMKHGDNAFSWVAYVAAEK